MVDGDEGGQRVEKGGYGQRDGGRVGRLECQGIGRRSGGARRKVYHAKLCSNSTVHHPRASVSSTLAWPGLTFPPAVPRHRNVLPALWFPSPSRGDKGPRPCGFFSILLDRVSCPPPLRPVLSSLSERRDEKRRELDERWEVNSRVRVWPPRGVDGPGQLVLGCAGQSSGLQQHGADPTRLPCGRLWVGEHRCGQPCSP